VYVVEREGDDDEGLFEFDGERGEERIGLE
jgi:hypothetical protein